MQQQNRRRYIWAIYSILALVAVVLTLIAFNYLPANDPMQALLINLATNLAGVFIIFAVVDQLFALNSQQELLGLTQEVGELRKEIAKLRNPALTSDDAQSQFDLAKEIQTSDFIDILGYSNKAVFDDARIRKALVDAALRGARVRVILVDARGPAGDLMRQHSLRPNLVGHNMEEVLDYAHEISTQVEGAKGSFQVNLTSWIPSIGMSMGSTQTGLGWAKINFHLPSFRQPRTDRRSLVLTKTVDREDFQFYESQFDHMWNQDSRPVDYSSIAGANTDVT